MNTLKLPPAGPVLARLHSGKPPKTDFSRQRVGGNQESEDSRFSSRSALAKVKGGLRVFNRLQRHNQPGSVKPIFTGGVFA